MMIGFWFVGTWQEYIERFPEPEWMRWRRQERMTPEERGSEMAKRVLEALDTAMEGK